MAFFHIWSIPSPETWKQTIIEAIIKTHAFVVTCRGILNFVALRSTDSYFIGQTVMLTCCATISLYWALRESHRYRIISSLYLVLVESLLSDHPTYHWFYPYTGVTLSNHSTYYSSLYWVLRERERDVIGSSHLAFLATQPPLVSIEKCFLFISNALLKSTGLV